MRGWDLFPPLWEEMREEGKWTCQWLWKCVIWLSTMKRKAMALIISNNEENVSSSVCVFSIMEGMRRHGRKPAYRAWLVCIVWQWQEGRSSESDNLMWRRERSEGRKEEKKTLEKVRRQEGRHRPIPYVFCWESAERRIPMTTMTAAVKTRKYDIPSMAMKSGLVWLRNNESGGSISKYVSKRKSMAAILL